MYNPVLLVSPKYGIYVCVWGGGVLNNLLTSYLFIFWSSCCILFQGCWHALLSGVTCDYLILLLCITCEQDVVSPHSGNRRRRTVWKSAWLWLASVAQAFSCSPRTPSRTRCSPGWTQTLKTQWRQPVQLEEAQQQQDKRTSCYLDDWFRCNRYHYLSRSALPNNSIRIAQLYVI